MAIKIYAIVDNGVVVNLTAAQESHGRTQANWVDTSTSEEEGVSIGWSYVDGVFAAPEEDLDYLWGEVRRERDELLTKSDWVVIKAKETGSNIPSAWKTYRQSLRDLTSTFDHPDNVEFPDPPTA